MRNVFNFCKENKVTPPNKVTPFYGILLIRICKDTATNRSFFMLFLWLKIVCRYFFIIVNSYVRNKIDLTWLVFTSADIIFHKILELHSTYIIWKKDFATIFPFLNLIGFIEPLFPHPCAPLTIGQNLPSVTKVFCHCSLTARYRYVFIFLWIKFATMCTNNFSLLSLAMWISKHEHAFERKQRRKNNAEWTTKKKKEKKKKKKNTGLVLTVYTFCFLAIHTSFIYIYNYQMKRPQKRLW